MEATYADMKGIGTSEAAEPIVIIVPEPRERKEGMMAWITVVGAFKFNSNTFHHASIFFSSAKRAMRVVPALLIKISIGPSSSSTCAKSGEGSEDRASKVSPRAGVEYLVLISAMRESMSAFVRARAATWAPAAANATAVERPMPREAPVMSITFPFREPTNLVAEMKGYVS